LIVVCGKESATELALCRQGVDPPHRKRDQRARGAVSKPNATAVVDPYATQVSAVHNRRTYSASDPKPRPPCSLFWFSNVQLLRSSSVVACARHCSSTDVPPPVPPVVQPAKAAPAQMTQNIAILNLGCMLLSMLNSPSSF
jgi:hypothetical protein